jgi:hypothetical protein
METEPASDPAIGATAEGLRAKNSIDLFISNPYVHFVISELWAALTAVAVYALFRLGAYAIQFLTDIMPLHDTSPALFLETTLSWGGALSASATFMIVSVYQLVVLIKRLWEVWSHDD